jgi:hypothetical protein
MSAEYIIMKEEDALFTSWERLLSDHGGFVHRIEKQAVQLCKVSNPDYVLETCSMRHRCYVFFRIPNFRMPKFRPSVYRIGP